ncbi:MULTISPECIES: ATP-binding cassette domain-containing protein [unclassified Nocardioides]|uniref:ATP-binding cassette domain-containing protein n=1 Tax=unclassified Nocardioides TaxID=2615069 RepID=UPI0009F03BE5|nr:MULTISPECIES: ABC transporter ATP-binding protein [unclassified Nocardioides]GAW51914.1 hypothetical protein PD653B2_4263 [Nocardioides sp. PD653-B2]GAW57608.1 hypothetical protein PD653_5053 [Nocardioides sp. PD653]
MSAWRPIPGWLHVYIPLVRRQRARFISSSLLVVLSAAAEAFSLVVLGYAATRSELEGTEAVLLSGLIGFSLAVSAGIRAGGEAAVALAQVDLERELRDDISKAILRSDWQDFVDQPGHELQSAVLAESPQVANATATCVRGFATGAAALVLFATAFFVSIYGALVCVLFAILITRAYSYASRGLGTVQKSLADGTTQITRHTAILVSGLRTLRLSPVQREWANDLYAAYDRQATSRKHDLRIPIRGRFVVELLGAVMIFGVLAVQTVASGNILPGLIVMALILRVLPRIQAAQQAWAIAKYGVIWVDRWNARLSTIAQHPLQEGRPDPPLRRQSGAVLEFDNVEFRYRSHLTSAIRGLSLSISAGEWVGVVGPSGGGKSTLIDLLGGILRPTQGQINLHDISIHEIDPDILHSTVAIVPQDIHLMGETLEEMLTWGGRLERPVNFDQICNSLGVTEMFLHSTVGLASKMDELGRDISGGMRTRLAVARALMTSPEVLVLDETTSRLHPTAEAAIFEDIRRTMPELAVMVVTHREETTKELDKVWRLESGLLRPSLKGGHP